MSTVMKVHIKLCSACAPYAHLYLRTSVFGLEVLASDTLGEHLYIVDWTCEENTVSTSYVPGQGWC